MKTKMDVERIGIIGDLHSPFVDWKSLMSALFFLRSMGITRLVINGDFTDFYAISRFNKSIDRKNNLQAEIDETVKILAVIRRVLGKRIPIDWIEGNHEVRMRVYLMTKAPELDSLRCLTMPELFQLDKYGVDYHEANSRGAHIRYGDVLVGHFDKVLKESGATAKALVNEEFCSIVQAHTHRMGTYYKSTTMGDYKGVEGGCLCELEPSYLDRSNWQQGVVLLERVIGNDRYNIVEVPIFDNKILFGGYVYGE